MVNDNAPEEFGTAKSIKSLSKLNIPGGGQVVVENGYAYVGHISPPYGTSIIDVRDVRHPRVVSQLMVPEGVHSHKVNVKGDLMLVNYELYQSDKPVPVGLKVFDVSNPHAPHEIAFFKVAPRGVHRFTFDGRYAYFSPVMEGYLGNIVMILDLKNPREPVEVSRWWLPGQWTAGGENPTWKGMDHRCHHPIRRGNRLYVSYWHAGFIILDISDISRPTLVSQLDWSPPYPSPTHTALPMPEKIMDRQVLVVTDEEVVRQKLAPTPPAFMWIVDITEETRPIPISTFMLPYTLKSVPGNYFGAHQPAEQAYDNLHYVTWFSGGLRAVDISNPYLPKEVGYYMPEPGEGQKIVQSNDVFRRDDGLLFLIDRLNGLEILEPAL